jgi:hypothetical protein
MHLMRRSEPLGGRLDLCGPTYPHVHRQTKDSVRRKLVQVDIEIPKDVDGGGVQGKPKPRVQQVAEDDDLVVARPRYSFPPRARPASTMRFFTREPTSVLYIWLRPNVYVFWISFATASRLRFGAMYAI